ncbi:MAG: response regulator [bacterium]
MSKKKGKVLVIDDDMEFRLSLKRTLKRAGYSVKTASGGAQAYKILSQRAYPLVLLDLLVPGESGLELLRELRHKSPDSKVIVISVDDMAETHRKAINDGAFAFLRKPVKMKKILTYASLAFT